MASSGSCARPARCSKGGSVWSAYVRRHDVRRLAGKDDAVSQLDFAILWQIGELDSVVGEHDIDLVRNGLDQSIEKGDRGRSISFLKQSGEGELRGAIGDEV